MNPEIEGLAQRAEWTRLQTIATIENSIETLRDMIAVNADLARQPGHRETGHQRVIDGEIELAALEAELAALRRGDVAEALDVHGEFPAPPPR